MSSAIYRGLASIVQTEEENLCVLVIKAFREIEVSRLPIGKRRSVLCHIDIPKAPRTS